MPSFLHVLGLFICILLTVLLFLDENQVYLFFMSSPNEETNYLSRSRNPNHNLMKPKYIWLMLDAYASFQTGDLKSFSNYSVFYHIKNTGYPQSAAIATTQVTGQNSRNYVGHEITTETIFEHINNYGSSLKANTFPLIDILGRDKFDDVKEYRGREDYPLSRLDIYYSLPDPIDLQTVGCESIEQAQAEITQFSHKAFANLKTQHIHIILNSLTKNQRKSATYYTSIMDSYNHNYGGLSGRAIAGASVLLADLKAIIQEIENSDYRDEYVFIVSSDHGGQIYFGEDEICNHGCQMDKGNEGFLYIYSYGTGHFEDWISNEDVSPIVAGYIKDSRIPIYASGWPRPIADGGMI